jgi:hypothetical protein
MIADYLVHAYGHRNACKRNGATLPPSGVNLGGGRWQSYQHVVMS